MEITYLDNFSVAIYPDSWGIQPVYNSDGTVNYASTTNGVYTWRRTYYYNGSKQITATSGWIRQ